MSLINCEKESAEWNYEHMLVRKPLQVALLNHDGTGIEEFDEVCNALVGLGSYWYHPKKLDLDLKNRHTPHSKSSISETPMLELTPLHVHLRYAYLGETETFSFFISIKLEE